MWDLSRTGTRYPVQAGGDENGGGEDVLIMIQAAKKIPIKTLYKLELTPII